MKKSLLTIAIVLGMSIGASAQGGLFQYGEVSDESSVPSWYSLDQNQKARQNMPMLPDHGQGTNQNAPLGSGVLLFIGFGAAYAQKKKKG